MSCVTTAGTVYNAQRLNKLLAQHWRSFAGQPYFDEQGVFISAVVSTPLLLTMFVQLVRAALQCNACCSLTVSQEGLSFRVHAGKVPNVSIAGSPLPMRILLPWVLIVAVRPCCTSIWGLDFARPFGSFMSVEPFSLSEGVIMCVLISLEFACTGNLSGNACFDGQVSYLCQTSQLLIVMKRKELRYKARQRALQERAAVVGTRESKKSS